MSNTYQSNGQQNQSNYTPNIYQSGEQQTQSNYTPNTYQSNGQQPQNSDNKSDDNSSCGVGLIFLLWFFGSIVVIFILSANKLLNGLCVATFGHVFLILGLIAFTKVSGAFEKIIPTVFIIAGGGMVLGGIAVQLGFKRQVMQMLPHITAIVLSVVGLIIILAPTISAIKKRQLCTEKVDAVISDLRFRYNRGPKGRMVKVYAPVYKYEYNDLTYTHTSDVYTNIGVKPVGTQLKIFINPLNPQEIYVRSLGGIAFAVGLGLFFIYLGVSLFIAIL